MLCSSTRMPALCRHSPLSIISGERLRVPDSLRLAGGVAFFLCVLPSLLHCPADSASLEPSLSRSFALNTAPALKARHPAWEVHVGEDVRPGQERLAGPSLVGGCTWNPAALKMMLATDTVNKARMQPCDLCLCRGTMCRPRAARVHRLLPFFARAPRFSVSPPTREPEADKAHRTGHTVREFVPVYLKSNPPSNAAGAGGRGGRRGGTAAGTRTAAHLPLSLQGALISCWPFLLTNSPPEF